MLRWLKTQGNIDMILTVKMLLVILLWSNDGSLHSSVAEVQNCPEVGPFNVAMEDSRKAGQFKGWAAYCNEVTFGSDSPI